VVLIDSRDGIFNPLKPNSLDFHSYEFKQVEHKIGKCIGKSIEKIYYYEITKLIGMVNPI
jgi:hypothetical protein